MASLIVRPVAGAADLQAFIDLPWAVQGQDPNWVPPLRSEVKKILDMGHPFWQRAERQLFLAERGGRPMGRIAAIMDMAHVEYWQELAGAWGFFECENDQEAASALFEEAQAWCMGKGLTHFRGPFNPSTNYEIGMLVQGFDVPPAIMMNYNPPWYCKLVEGAGLAKEKDLLAFEFRRGHKLPQWVLDIANRLVDKGEVRLRHMDKKNLLSEVELMSSLYQAAWARNWGFVPMSHAEIEAMAESLLPILDEDMAFFLYVGDDPAAVGLMLPDVSPLLKRLNGKLGMAGLVKYLLYKSEIRGVRALLFGVKPQYHQMGVPLAALHYVLEKAETKTRYETLEMSWNLEDNEAINNLLLDFGGRVSKRYRLYRKDF